MGSALTPEGILQLGMACRRARALHGVGEGAGGRKYLVQRLGLHPRSARDFLDALVALKMLERENGIYRNTPATDLFLDRAKASYVGGILEMANTRL